MGGKYNNNEQDPHGLNNYFHKIKDKDIIKKQHYLTRKDVLGIMGFLSDTTEDKGNLEHNSIFDLIGRKKIIKPEQSVLMTKHGVVAFGYNPIAVRTDTVVQDGYRLQHVNYSDEFVRFN